MFICICDCRVPLDTWDRLSSQASNYLPSRPLHPDQQCSLRLTGAFRFRYAWTGVIGYHRMHSARSIPLEYLSQTAASQASVSIYLLVKSDITNLILPSSFSSFSSPPLHHRHPPHLRLHIPPHTPRNYYRHTSSSSAWSAAIGR